MSKEKRKFLTVLDAFSSKIISKLNLTTFLKLIIFEKEIMARTLINFIFSEKLYLHPAQNRPIAESREPKFLET